MNRILFFTLFLLFAVGCGANGSFVVTAHTPTTQVEQAKELLKNKVSVLAAAAATKAAHESAKAAEERINHAGEGTQSAGSGGAETDESAQEVAWNPAADAIILQLSEGGGFRVAPSATDLPQWTLYGDGMVVWTDDSTDATAGFTKRVWMGQLSEAEMRELLGFANQSGFFGLEPSYSINDESEVIQTENGEVLTNPQIMDLPSGTLMLNLTGKQHSVQMYPPNYEKMPNAYRALRERLLQTRPAEPFTHTPSSYRLNVSRLGRLEDLAQGTRNRLVEWTFNEINLEQVSTTPQTIDSRKGVEISKLLVNRGNLIMQDGVGYEVRLFGNPPRPIK